MLIEYHRNIMWACNVFSMRVLRSLYGSLIIFFNMVGMISDNIAAGEYKAQQEVRNHSGLLMRPIPRSIF